MAEEEQSISASIFGQSVAAKGISGIILLVVVCALFGAGYLLWDSNNANRQALTTMSLVLGEHATSMQNEHKAIAKSMETLIEVGTSSGRQLKIQNYIILSDPKEKEDIKRKLGRPVELQ